MTPKYNRVHNKFKLNGLHFSHEALKEVSYSLIKEGEPFEKAIGDFLLDWLNDKDYVFVKTSGSTGKPKTIKLYKQAMVNSAIATANFFNLKSGNTALACLPGHYIAGKMMFVRAMVLGLNIDSTAPTSTPIFDYAKHYDFCAMVPLQLQNVIKHSNNIKTIIIGGSKASSALLEKIERSNLNIYETYGMTETITHVALKKLPSKVAKGDAKFKALPNVKFKQDERNCLVIEAPKLNTEPVVTNDIVDLKSDTSFQWLGRFDNVINSGGVKLFPEQIEGKLQKLFKERILVAGKPDAKFGEKLILILENPSESIKIIQENILKLKTLNKFEIPKEIYSLDAFIETTSGKIQRRKTLEAILG